MQPYSAADYLGMLQALLPPGAAWTREPDAVLTRVLAGLADALARVDERAHLLMEEARPWEALWLLADWETECGLPDECSQPDETVAERRAAVVLKITATGGQNPEYFAELARAYTGLDCTVREFRPFRAGMSAAGDPLTNGDWIFTWRIHAPETVIRPFRAGQGCAGEPLRTWGNEALECALPRLAPAHTLLQFTYEEDV